MSVGVNLKHLREKKGLSQKELANAVHVSQPMIAQIERGTKRLTVELAKEILDVLGASINEIWN